ARRQLASFPTRRSSDLEAGGSADNCRAVLIVVEYWNIHPLAQFLFNIETFWRFNVFEVDAAEGRFKRGDDFNKFVRVEFINFNVKYINPGEFLKQNALAFHHRFACQRANVA